MGFAEQSMNLASRIGTLAAVGVTVAGLAHAGWFAGLWLVTQASSPASELWLPVLAQAGLTFVVAGAVVFGVQRQLAALRRSLTRVEEQVDALEQGRFVIIGEVPSDEAAELSRRTNSLVRRLQQTLTVQPAGPSGAVDALRRAAPSDPATGVDSRFSFLRRLTERLADKQVPETALLVVRQLGGDNALEHDAVDETAATLVELLRSYPARVAGSFVGRLNDTDFALCLPAHGVAEDTANSLMAAAQAGHLRCVIAAADQIGGLSLGSALALVDAAISRAEAGGSGSIEWRSGRESNAQPVADSAMRKAILDALRGGQAQLGEFPVLDAHGNLLHLESPMRLKLSGDSFEPASSWLGVASRYRLMTQIDLTGLELALAACAADGRSRCIHVAAESLAAAGFVSAVRSRLEAHPSAAARLWIEISEVSFERLPPRLRNAGTVWRRCGARVGIEHAGAALRSLVRVGELDLDYVKVDSGFVQGLAFDASQRERARGLVAFVHEMGARVIAEGVDDAGDLQSLWELGFDGATGKAATERYAHCDDETGFDQLTSPV